MYPVYHIHAIKDNAPQQEQRQQQPRQYPSEDGGGGGSGSGGGGGGGAQLASWAVLSPPLVGGAYKAHGASASTPIKKKPAWGAAGLASDGLSAEERELKEALEASRLAAADAAAAVASEEERQLAAAREASRIAEEAREREEFDAKVAMDVSTVYRFIAVAYTRSIYAELGGEVVSITQQASGDAGLGSVYCCDVHAKCLFFSFLLYIS